MKYLPLSLALQAIGFYLLHFCIDFAMSKNIIAMSVGQILFYILYGVQIVAAILAYIAATKRDNQNLLSQTAQKRNEQSYNESEFVTTEEREQY